MYEFQQKRRLRKTLYSKTSIAILIIISVFIVHGSWGAFQKERQSRKNMEEVEKELNEARKKELELSMNIENLNTSQGVEREIREKFSVKRDGEEVVLVIDSNDITTSSAPSVSLWAKIKNWIANLFKNNQTP